jgi:tyrosyl-tRNA synthetase
MIRNFFFQMGNIVTGYELIQRVSVKGKEDIFGILLPLVTSETGDKFGKSAGAPVWLSPDKTTPYDFFQV